MLLTTKSTRRKAAHTEVIGRLTKSVLRFPQLQDQLLPSCGRGRVSDACSVHHRQLKPLCRGLLTR